ncbi:MAG TPA: hypothetical protein VG870_09085 [Chitinophagaceae bacterium]|nr:hypothetical protein [Chitinophagaceae bacterium]
MKHRKTIFFSLTALLVIAGGVYGLHEYTRKNADLGHVRADLQISAGDLIRKMETGGQAAERELLAKKDYVIAVTGSIKEISRDEKGYYTIALGNPDGMSSVRCAMDTMHQKGLAGLATGATVTIQGAFTGFNQDPLLGSDVILNRCVISNKKP